MDAYDPVGSESEGSSKTFIALVVISQILGLICILLTGFWLGIYWGGFSWATSPTIFNYHPLFMVLGLVFLYGDAILVYRVFSSYRKLPIKVLHAVLHILAFMFGVLGIKAAFEMHNSRNIKNMYSIHSWLGIICIVLFGLQWVAGLMSFLVPQTPRRFRARYLPIHVSFGSLLYILIIGTCIAGITEKNFFSDAYPQLRSREVLGNILGVCLVLFASVVFYLIQHPSYRRPEQLSPEHRALHQ